MALKTREISVITKLSLLERRYKISLTTSFIEVGVKDLDLPFESNMITRGGGGTRNLQNLCPVKASGNGCICKIQIPSNCVLLKHNSYTDLMSFDDIIDDDTVLYRLSDNGPTKSSNFVNGKTALNRAKFDRTTKRCVLAFCVKDMQDGCRWVHIFFSQNLQRPGVVVVMPDPDGQIENQCVSILDFYDTNYWRSEVPAVNHNNIDDFMNNYRK